MGEHLSREWMGLPNLRRGTLTQDREAGTGTGAGYHVIRAAMCAYPRAWVDVLQPVSIAHSSAVTITRSTIGSLTSA